MLDFIQRVISSMYTKAKGFVVNVVNNMRGLAMLGLSTIGTISILAARGVSSKLALGGGLTVVSLLAL